MRRSISAKPMPLPGTTSTTSRKRKLEIGNDQVDVKDRNERLSKSPKMAVNDSIKSQGENASSESELPCTYINPNFCQNKLTKVDWISVAESNQRPIYPPSELFSSFVSTMSI
jgi:hypothetical protein